jgi:hypothetical protein
VSFSPGQFITAQRLNRLQPKTYWAQASAFVSTVTSGNAMAGTSMSITVETNGATANFWFTAAVYSTGAMGAIASTQGQWDVNSSPTFAVVQLVTANEKASAGNHWSTTIPTAGTYTFSLKYNNPSTFSSLSTYCAIMVQIVEVA